MAEPRTAFPPGEEAPARPGLPGLLDVLDLERVEVDLFRTRYRTDTPGRLFGGQVAAQSLVAAERTAPEDATPHSLHAYFLRPGDTRKHVVYKVERLHDGRTFQRRRVTAIQEGAAILALETSFTRDDSAANYQQTAPVMPAPEDCPPGAWPDGGIAKRLNEAFDVRVINPEADNEGPFMRDLWFRPRGGDTDGRVSRSAVLAFFSDFTLAATIARPTGRTGIERFTSLDHVLWFHNQVRLDDWLLYAKTTVATGPLRGLAQGGIFHRDGTLIVTVAQEGLINRTSRRA
jgi:acyl-CoA thioesterase-2